MTIPIQKTLNTYTANGTETVFSYSFLLLKDNDLEVSIDGVEQTNGSDYHISGIGDASGGTITLHTAPKSGSRILLSRLLPIQRLSIGFDHDFDRVWQALQQLEDNASGIYTNILAKILSGDAYKGEWNAATDYASEYVSRIGAAGTSVKVFITGRFVSYNGHLYDFTDGTYDQATPPDQQPPNTGGWVRSTGSIESYLQDASFDFYTYGYQNQHGYQKLPSGLIMQWGLSLSDKRHGSNYFLKYPILFPVAFSESPFIIQATEYKFEKSREDSHELYITVEKETKTEFTFRLGRRLGNSPARNEIHGIYWFAIGR